MRLQSIRIALHRAVAGVAVALAAAVAVGPFTPTASAQFGGQSNFAEAFQPDYLPRDMAIFNEYLGLEDWQRPIVEMLLDDYQTSFHSGVDGVREAMKRVSERLQNDAGAADVMDLVMGPVQTWMSEKRQLADQFLGHVKNQLSDRQREQWPAFERAVRRDKELPRGELSGESVNLVVVLRDMPLDSATRSAIQPVLDRYVLRLDETLVARSNVQRSVEGRLADAMRSMDFDAGIAANEQIMTARVAVRSVQDELAAEVERALPSSFRADFRERQRLLAYSKVYRSGGQMDRFFEAVRAIEDLRPEQLASLDMIEIGYMEQLSSINDQMVDAVRKEEPQEMRRRTEVIRARTEGTAPPVREPSRSSQLMIERDAVGEQTRTAVLALLSPEQVAQLPTSAKTRLSREVTGPAGLRDSAPDPRRNPDADKAREQAIDRPGIGGSGGAPERGRQGREGQGRGGEGDGQEQRRQAD